VYRETGILRELPLRGALVTT